jgi:hypothetical protein
MNPKLAESGEEIRRGEPQANIVLVILVDSLVNASKYSSTFMDRVMRCFTTKEMEIWQNYSKLRNKIRLAKIIANLITEFGWH